MVRVQLLGCLMLCGSAYALPLANALQRRHDHEPMCGLDKDLSSYRVVDNVVGLFVILGFSFVGCGVAAAAGRMGVHGLLVDMGRHFGTGVIISTGFVHMLMAAIEHLTSPCAPEAIREYSAFGCVVAIGSALLMHLIEQVGGVVKRRARRAMT
ncbi:low-affinity Zn(2+) transporter zrt2 [Entomophthora muscae]|uniref:Low-affinity Zn(2+) transporter zrt2 n=1 Tax=Entomophthora muscae TaxID=34485 RepID=A0ACC2UUB9_9FUNG|nr:low-affinity Zn(2+) transporter zrt2 [Entomophthora muscae]